MNKVNWELVRHFKPSENWGDADKMNPKLIYRLDSFRDHLKIPIVVTRGIGVSEFDHSQHPLGNAVDIVFPNRKLFHLIDIYHEACSFGFTGVGLYPHWHYHDRVVGGLHIDMRSLKQRQKAARWLCVLVNGKQTYIGFSYANLKKYAVI